MNRTGKSARNFLFTLLSNAAAVLIGLAAQKIFIRILGLEYSGLNGLFSNVITMLGIADLGIGEAVVFHMYRPLEEDDRETVCSLMAFYRKAFRIVALVIAAVGIALIPLLPYIAKTENPAIHLTPVYLIFLLDVVFSYLLSYKRSILYADQKNYIVNVVHMAYLILMNTGQLLMVLFTHNYYLYLLVKLFFRILENVVIIRVVGRSYPYLAAARGAKPLKPEILADIKKKVGALFFHKVGTFCVNGTDNILISAFLGLATAGLYSNYFLVIDAVTKLFGPAVSALTPSVGHLLVEADSRRLFGVFRRIRFMNFWIACFAATSLLTMVQPFVSVWFGPQYLLTVPVVMLLAFQLFQTLMRGSYNAFQDAAGIFYENRFVPLAESALNLISSLVLLRIWGLAGVFMGTIISGTALWCFSYPRFVYRKLFERGYAEYARETAAYILLFMAVAGSTFFLSGILSERIAALSGGSGLVQLAADAVLCVVYPNAVLALVFMKSDLFHYFIGLVRGRLQKR